MGYACRMAHASRSVTVELPDEGFLSHPWDPEELAGELRLLWLIEQVRERRLGHGKAAELSGLPTARFLKEMGKHGVSPFDYDPGELAEELGSIA
jgi:predicted HTH domain antitoxin